MILLDPPLEATAVRIVAGNSVIEGHPYSFSISVPGSSSGDGLGKVSRIVVGYAQAAQW
jgi:hypothetical protein